MARLLVALGLLAGGACESRGAGAPCTSHGQCDDGYQCLDQICSPRCESNSVCGDGYRCTDSGLCNLVVSSIGDRCQSEWDCGLKQSCVLDASDPNNDQQLEASCQEQGVGGNVGSDCTADSDCRNNLCSLGHCSQVCQLNSDCPQDTGCEAIPRIIDDDSALFRGCLQNTGVLSTTFPMDSPSQRLLIPVPSSAQSFAVVAKTNDREHLVGVTRVVSPQGRLLFRESGSFEEFINNPIRYSRAQQVSTLLYPNSDTLAIETGIYEVDVEASLPPFGPGTSIPEVTVFYKVSASRILDLHFYFLDLDEHPCRDSFDVNTLDSITAVNSKNFQEDYPGEIKSIFSQADVQIGKITYSDIERADLDGVTGKERLGELLILAQNTSGIAIFLVRSLSPDGIQALGNGVPGPPTTPETVSSGVAVAVDTLCYRSWEDMARVTAHSMAGHMGLWDNRDLAGTTDPIDDSDSSSQNLMFFGEFGGTELSEGQRRILGLYPGLR